MFNALCFGAILWDIVEEEKRIGGAPFNFAAHLSKLGLSSYLYTRIGSSSGDVETMNQLVEKGVNTEFVQRDTFRETGYSKIQLDDNRVPVYQFCKNGTHEYIDVTPEIIDSIRQKEFQLFYYGTFCQRGSVTRNSLQTIMQSCTFPVTIFDINLREPYPDFTILQPLLKYTDILKLNEDELIYISKLFLDDYSDFQESVLKIKEIFGIKIVCITKGPDGSTVFDEINNRYDLSVEHVEIVDTVGAGDAFCAGFVFAYLNGNSIPTCAQFANALGGFVCTRKEAVPEYPITIKKMIEKLEA